VLTTSLKLFRVLAAVAIVVVPATATARGVQASVYIAPAGSDSNPCTQSAPCRSFDRAYTMALGTTATVQVATGTYGAQTVSVHSAAANSGTVVFTPAPNAAVTLTGQLDIYGSKLEFRNFTVGGLYVHPGSDSVTFRQITDTAGLFITSASNVSMFGGSVGPGTDYSSEIKAASGSSTPPSNIIIQGVTFHDWRRTGPGVHLQCLAIFAGANITIRDSRFTRCDVMDLYVSKFGIAGAPHDITIENDVFDTVGAGGFYAVSIGGFPAEPVRNVLIRNNSSLQTMLVSSSGTENVRFVANIGPRAPYHCYAGVEFDYNVWDGAACSPTDTNAPSGFVDAAHLDLQLQPGSAALGHGAPGDAPPRDIDGNLRPLRVPADAGAYQRDPVPFRIGLSLGAVRMGETQADVTAFYGTPITLRTRRYGSAAPPVRVATYSEHGAALWVAYDDDRVVGVGTTSPYFTDARGDGVGVPVRSPQSSGLVWHSCPGAYFRAVNGVRTWLTTVLHRPSGAISSVWILTARYDGRPGCNH
jgi:hypothetical protein